jgi:hypothetical protein
MWRNHLCAVIGSLSCSVGVATAADRPKTYDEMIARQAEIHDVPKALVHRIVKRESRYQPGLVNRHCFGLMQIKYATAREMGYKGDAKGLKRRCSPHYGPHPLRRSPPKRRHRPDLKSGHRRFIVGHPARLRSKLTIARSYHLLARRNAINARPGEGSSPSSRARPLHTHPA